MKNGKNLSELATELERQAASKKDYLADTRRLHLEVRDDSLVLEGVNGGMQLRDSAHQQLSATLAIPKPYYDRLLKNAPDLLVRNVNHWFEREPSNRLVRTMDGKVRAVLSSSYRPLDNIDLATAVLPKLGQLEAQVLSSEITESRFYLKAVTQRIQGQVKVGDVIQAGVAISNSEIGQGSLRVEALDYRLACLNGAIRESAIRKAHLGRGHQDAIEDAREYFRDATREADDKAFFLKVQDATAAMFDPSRFMLRIEQYKEASERKIEADPVKVVEVTAKRFGLNETEKSGVLQHLIRGGDLSAWGVMNAITRQAQDVDSYDRSTELEAVGPKVIELSPSEWKTLAA
jgi:hypothetical protein